MPQIYNVILLQSLESIPGNGLLGELIPMLLSAKFPCHNNRLVALAYLEIVTRIYKIQLLNSQQYVLLPRSFLIFEVHT
ncbi:PREDICTED: exportin-T-like [Nicotiana attenuata]|uniref:exportin-T-like n=1 Tax=Nicotiana attenuata TaxID=49451 RepID=UPI000904E405|nr:PREDICTED: exportin-T-like [Nicotiana attenuata]